MTPLFPDIKRSVNCRWGQGKAIQCAIRIHTEHVVQRVKTFRVLRNEISLSSHFHHLEISIRKVVLKNSAKFTEKYSWQRLQPVTLLKKILWHRCFPVSSAKLSGTPKKKHVRTGISGEIAWPTKVWKTQENSNLLFLMCSNDNQLCSNDNQVIKCIYNKSQNFIWESLVAICIFV